jgi:hypothetical protein
VGPFSRARVRLLGRPLFIATVTVLPVCYLVWMLGWWRTGYITFGQLVEFRLSTDDKRRLLGFAHLWYLEYLLIYSLTYAAWRRLRIRTPARPATGGTFTGFLILAGAWCATLALLDPAMITDFRNGFLPRATYLAYNGAFFGLGVMLWHARAAIPQSRLFWVTLIVLAHAVFVAWVMLERRAPLATTTTLTACAFALLNSLGFTGLALVSRWDPGAAAAPLRTLVRAAYFTYLVHLPIVGAANIALWSLQIPAVLKFGLCAFIGLCVPLLLHRILIRRASAIPPKSGPGYSSPAS